MLYVHSSNRLENLADALVRVISESGSSAEPLDIFNEWICVQSMGMRTWLKREISARSGVFAGMRMPFPSTVIQTLLSASSSSDVSSHRLYERRIMAMEIFQKLPGFLGLPAFQPVSTFLAGERDGLSRMAFAIRIAALFDEYMVYRPEMLREWETEDSGEWQPFLWNALVERRALKRRRTDDEFLGAVTAGS